MKKLLALLFAGIMVFGLAACGGTDNSAAPADYQGSADVAPAETDAAPAETPAEPADEAPEEA